MAMDASELERRLAELDRAGQQQVNQNTPPPRDLGGLDLSAMQAMQRMRGMPPGGAPMPGPMPGRPMAPPTAAFPPLPPQGPPPMPPMPPGPPTAAFPPLPPQGRPRNLGALQPMTAVRGY